MILQIMNKTIVVPLKTSKVNIFDSDFWEVLLAFSVVVVNGKSKTNCNKQFYKTEKPLLLVFFY